MSHTSPQRYVSFQRYESASASEEPEAMDPQFQGDSTQPVSHSSAEGGESPTKNVPRIRRVTVANDAKLLNEVFMDQTRFPDLAMREALSKATNMTPRKVQIWFQNRRQKLKLAMKSAYYEDPRNHRDPRAGTSENASSGDSDDYEDLDIYQKNDTLPCLHPPVVNGSSNLYHYSQREFQERRNSGHIAANCVVPTPHWSSNNLSRNNIHHHDMIYDQNSQSHKRIRLDQPLMQRRFSSPPPSSSTNTSYRASAANIQSSDFRSLRVQSSERVTLQPDVQKNPIKSTSNGPLPFFSNSGCSIRLPIPYTTRDGNNLLQKRSNSESGTGIIHKFVVSM